MRIIIRNIHVTGITNRTTGVYPSNAQYSKAIFDNPTGQAYAQINHTIPLR